MIKKGKWDLEKDVDKMWNEIASWIKKLAKEYTMNLKDVSDRLRRFGSGIRRFKQYWERERERERERE